MKKILIYLVLIISPLFMSADFPAPSGMVNDYSGVLSNNFKTQLESNLRDLKYNTGIEISVVIVNSTSGDSIESFATSLFEKWGIGSKDKNNGVLLLIIPPQKKIRIEVGYGLEPYVNDARAGRIIRDTIAPYFKNGDFDGGVASGVNAIVQLIVDPENHSDVKQAEKTGSKLLGLIAVIFFVFMAIKYPRLALLFMLFGGNSQGGFGGRRGGFGGFGGFGGGMSGGGGASGGW